MNVNMTNLGLDKVHLCAFDDVLCQVRACLIRTEMEMSEADMQFVCIDNRLIKSDTKTNIKI